VTQKRGKIISRIVCRNIVTQKPPPDPPPPMPTCPNHIYQVVLIQYAATLWFCPVCGMPFVSSDFKNDQAIARRKEKTRLERVEQLRKLYKRPQTIKI
jgi:hypothetical protein